LTLGVQDDQVATLGLEGKSHLMRNMITAELYKDETGTRRARIKGRTPREDTVIPIPVLRDPESLIRPVAPPRSASVAAPRSPPVAPPSVRTGDRPVEPIPDIGYPRRDTGSCVNDALAQMLGYDPGLPSWVIGDDFPKVAQHYGLEYASGDDQNGAIIRKWIESGEPIAMVWQTGEGIGHVEYTRTPIETLEKYGWPTVRGAFFHRSQSTHDPFLAFLLSNGVPSHQDATERPVTPVPGNGSNDGNGHTSVVVEGESGGGSVVVNVTQVAPQPGRRGRDLAETKALEAVYESAGAAGDSFARAYARHKGTKEIAFTAWQRGRDASKGGTP